MLVGAMVANLFLSIAAPGAVWEWAGSKTNGALSLLYYGRLATLTWEGGT